MKSYIFEISAVGNKSFVTAKIPNHSFWLCHWIAFTLRSTVLSVVARYLSAQRFCRDEKGRQFKSMTIRKLQMNAPLHPLYTNEVSPEFLRSLNDSPFTEQQVAQFSEQAQAIIRQQQAYVIAHPPVAVYRWATEGSQTRNGGVVQQATAPMEYRLDNGQQVRVAQQGDYVMYADGSAAQIVTASGEGFGHLALVGSRLSNGDEIINTPQGSGLVITRQGVPMAEDFLASTEG